MECAHCHCDKPGKDYSFYYGIERELSHEAQSVGKQGYIGSSYSSKTTYGFDIQGQDQRFICNACVFKFYDWRVPIFRILRWLVVIIISVGYFFPLGDFEGWFFVPVILAVGLLALFALCVIPIWMFLRKRSEKDRFFSRKRHIYRRQDILELWAADLAGNRQNLFTTFEKRAYLDKNKLSFIGWLNKMWNPGIEWVLAFILVCIAAYVYY